MKRIDKIYDYILQNSKNFNIDKLLEQKGFSAQEIGDTLDIDGGELAMVIAKELL